MPTRISSLAALALLAAPVMAQEKEKKLAEMPTKEEIAACQKLGANFGLIFLARPGDSRFARGAIKNPNEFPALDFGNKWPKEDLPAIEVPVGICTSSGSAATDATLKRLKPLKKLVALQIEATRVTDAGLEELTGHTELLYLDVHFTDTITDKGMAAVGKLTKLAHLDLTATKVTGKGLAELKGLTALEHLSLSFTSVDDDGVKVIEKFTALINLDLTSSKVTDAGVKGIASLQKLKILHLSRTKVTDAGVKTLAGLKGLTSLDLDDTALTDKGLVELHGLSELKYLNVRNTKVTKAGVAAFKKAVPKCDVSE